MNRPSTHLLWLMLLFLLQGCGSEPPAQVPSTSRVDRGKCADFELDVERFWSAKSRTSVAAGILGANVEASHQISERVVTKMDELTRDWVLMQEGICKDTVERQIMSTEVYVKVSLCLRSTLSAQRTLVETLKHATKEHVFSVDTALAKVQEDGAACQKEAVYSSYDEKEGDTAARDTREKLAQVGVYSALKDNRADTVAKEAVQTSSKSQALRVKVDALLAAAREANIAGRYQEAIELAQQGVGLAQSDDYQLGIGEGQLVFGDTYYELGEYERARLILDDAARRFQRLFGPDDIRAAEARGTIALIYLAQEDMTHANSELQAMMEIVMRASGVLASERGTRLRVFHIMSRMTSYFTVPAVLPILETALALYRRELGEQHPEVAILMNSRGRVEREQGDFAGALLTHEAALDMLQKTVGEQHPLTAQTYIDIGDVHRRQGNADQALQVYQRALAIFRGVFGEKNLKTASAYGRLGNVALDQGDASSALRNYQISLDTQRSILGKESPLVVIAEHDIALSYLIAGDYDRAISGLTRALESFRRLSGEDTRLATTYANLGRAYLKKGDLERSASAFEQSLALRRKLLGEADAQTAKAYLDLGAVYERQGSDLRALAQYQAGVRSYSDAYGPTHERTVEAKGQVKALCARTRACH